MRKMRWREVMYPPAGTVDAIRGPWVRKKIAEDMIKRKLNIIKALYEMLSEISWKYKAKCDQLQAAKKRYYKAWRMELAKNKQIEHCFYTCPRSAICCMEDRAECEFMPKKLR